MSRDFGSDTRQVCLTVGRYLLTLRSLRQIERLECAAQRMSADAGTGGPSQTIQQSVGANLSRGWSPFVGRAFELQQLQGAFEGVARGDGALVMLAGEPGIGKTALCQQLAGFVATRNAFALLGHCAPRLASRCVPPDDGDALQDL